MMMGGAWCYARASRLTLQLSELSARCGSRKETLCSSPSQLSTDWLEFLQLVRTAKKWVGTGTWVPFRNLEEVETNVTGWRLQVKCQHVAVYLRTCKIAWRLIKPSVRFIDE